MSMQEADPVLQCQQRALHVGCDGCHTDRIRESLPALKDGIGLLHRHGRRWNSRKLVPGELSGVAVTGGDTITLALADFGWPRAHIRMDDPDARSAWLARLGAFAAASGQAHPAVTRHA